MTADHLPTAGPSWAAAPPPEGECCWRWRPESLADLPAIRSSLRAGLAAQPCVPGVDGRDVIDRVVTVVDELASNALRHGHLPVVVEVGAADEAWVMQVSDRSADAPPVPVADRDPALGGIGLRIVATLTSDCAWHRVAGGKAVWGTVVGAPVEEPPTDPRG